MRICQLIAPGPMAGAEKVVLDGSMALRKAGAEVTVCIMGERRNPGPATQFAAEAKTRRLRTALFPAEGRIDTELLRSLRRFNGLAGFDVVHLHGYKAVLYGLMARTGRELLVATHHGETARTTALKAYVKLALWAYRRLDRVVAVSNVTRQSLIDRGVPAERVVTLENFVPTMAERSPLAAEPRKPTGGPVELLFLGRLSPEKGLDVMLEAMARANHGSRLSLTIVGDGPDRDALTAQAKKLGLNGSVRFEGYRTDGADFLARADALVLPSRREGMPMALLEALAVGCPVVASRVGGIPDRVTDGVNGLLVPPDDVSALVVALERLAAGSELAGLRGRASAAAPHLRLELGPERWAGKLLETYRAGITER